MNVKERLTIGLVAEQSREGCQHLHKVAAQSAEIGISQQACKTEVTRRLYKDFEHKKRELQQLKSKKCCILCQIA